MKRVFAAAMLAACAGCAGLPSLEGRLETHALADTAATRLARATAPLESAHPGKTGIFAMPLATDAFAARILLARAAQRSIDAQYYIWHDDQTGLLLLEALCDAAQGGVRVRLLLDDQNTKGLDVLLASVAATPNLELRLYNPFASRGARFLDYFGGFERLNRRMHNKSFIVDGVVAIVGGRNIGDAYFDASVETNFRDLDVVAIGSVVGEAEQAFDNYWNSDAAYPVKAFKDHH
ncbi:MAG TPA: phospholipase D-like domain-containing protein, partial [Usitatibacter sp.]|nr:phospholipase D-like domain-containing protein [Usitatibacter sp.]